MTLKQTAILKPLSVLVSVMLLTACGSQTIAPVSGGDGRSATGGSKMIPSKKGGGYYKDDGPGEEVPANLDEIPDAEPKWEPLYKPALKPYTVLGKSYVPQSSLQPFKQRGLASWYGKKFHGQKTSNGEIYNMFGMSAAHTTLPLPSYVRVRNLSNDRTVIVRVNDRGPFHSGRIIDLSYTASHKLGLIGRGSGEVEIETVMPGEKGTTYASVGSPTKPVVVPPPVEARPMDRSIDENIPPGIYLQFGAYANRQSADGLRNELTREMEWAPQPIRLSSTGTIHRIQMGPFATRAEAEVIAERIQREFGQKPIFATH